MLNCFFTIEYKGFYIHGNNKEITVQTPLGALISGFKSVDSAKVFITNY